MHVHHLFRFFCGEGLEVLPALVNGEDVFLRFLPSLLPWSVWSSSTYCLDTSREVPEREFLSAEIWGNFIASWTSSTVRSGKNCSRIAVHRDPKTLCSISTPESKYQICMQASMESTQTISAG